MISPSNQQIDTDIWMD
uniref:Uncharacterized protein n=1 Tax=Arundo donax TaxID=35708 RepID=A0A0A9A4B7_ARUDO